MTKAERFEIEARADRCLRRGELAEALSLYERISSHFPDDASLQRKLAQVRDSLQPTELTHAKANLREPPPADSPLEAQAERRVATGDLAGAIALYRRALQAKPDNELIQERLAELFRLAQQAPQSSAPKPPEDPAGLLRDLLQRLSSRRRA